MIEHHQTPICKNIGGPYERKKTIRENNITDDGRCSIVDNLLELLHHERGFYSSRSLDIE
jgi:hypothetical protein